MKHESRKMRIEPRWPVALAIVAVAFLLTVLPERVRVYPDWALWALGILVLAPILGVGATAGKPPWTRMERVSTLLFFLIAAFGTLVNLATLIGAITQRSAPLSGVQLLMSSIAMWVSNVLAFSLLYWQIDRGGPEARLRREDRRPDWLFPHESVPQSVADDWRPIFVDYLFLAFSTATAFSPTHALPLTSRAMLLMMLESVVALVTLVVVAARSINVLGG